MTAATQFLVDFPMPFGRLIIHSVFKMVFFPRKSHSTLICQFKFIFSMCKTGVSDEAQSNNAVLGFPRVDSSCVLFLPSDEKLPERTPLWDGTTKERTTKSRRYARRWILFRRVLTHIKFYWIM